MKTIKLPIAVLLLSLGVALSGAAMAQTHAKPKTTALNTQQAKASYALGVTVGMGFKRQGLKIDPAIFMEGLEDAVHGKKPRLSEEEARTALTELRKQVMARREAEMKAQSEKNAKEGSAFLAANKSKPGVKTLPSGLEYKIIKQGTGPKPTLSDVVVCNYRGTLVNGTEFDSSYKRGQPATFPVKGVIKGWTEILQKMPVGSEYKVFIPADLAYGLRAPAVIGPNSTLIFDIKLLSIKEKK